MSRCEDFMESQLYFASCPARHTVRWTTYLLKTAARKRLLLQSRLGYECSPIKKAQTNEDMHPDARGAKGGGYFLDG